MTPARHADIRVHWHKPYLHPGVVSYHKAMEKQIDPKLVRHIGKLARIELSDDEVQTFSRQLGGILTYLDKLNELDTSNVEPMAHAVEIQNVFAPDTPHESLTPQEALANAPQRDGDFFMVPKVIGDSQ